jgi:hypothetical protein
LVHHVEAHHEHLPDRIAQCACEHFVGVVGDRILGDADVPDLAFPLLRFEGRRQRVERIVIVIELDAVQIEHIDVALCP